MFFHESLELLLHLANSRLMFLPLGALRGRLLFGLGKRLLKGRHLSYGPYDTNSDPVIFCNYIFLNILHKVLLTFFFLELLFSKAELLLGPLEALLSASTSAVSVAEASSEACIRILT